MEVHTLKKTKNKLVSLIMIAAFIFSLNTKADEIVYDENSVEYEVWHTMEDLGYSDYAIAGAMGNMYWESHFETQAVECGGSGYGLVQWTGSRQWDFVDFCTDNGYSTASVYAQIIFLDKESQSNSRYYAWMDNGGFTKVNFDYGETIEETTSTFFHCFERPGDDSLLDRIAAAYRYYEYFVN